MKKRWDLIHDFIILLENVTVNTHIFFWPYTVTVCKLVWYDRTLMMHAANISGIMLFFL